MACCIVDSVDKIAGLAKLFFSELSKKGNTLYNVMPDIVSRLSDPEKGVEEEPFRTIMKYIFVVYLAIISHEGNDNHPGWV